MWYVRDRFDFVCELVLVTVCAGEIEPCVCVVWLGFFYLAPRSVEPEPGTLRGVQPQTKTPHSRAPARLEIRSGCAAGATAAAGTPF